MKGTNKTEPFDLTAPIQRNVIQETEGNINPFVTIVQRGTKRVAFLATSIRLEAAKFPSRYLSSLGKEVPSVQLTVHGQPILNYTMSASPLVEDEIAHLKAWALNSEPELGQDQLAFVGDIEAQQGGRNVAKGEQLATVFWKDDAIPFNQIKNAETGKLESKMSSEVLGNLKDLGSGVIARMVTSEDWKPFLTSVEEGGWLKVRDFTPKANPAQATENVDIAADLAAAATVVAPTADSGSAEDI